jgi:hypothetical protein
VWVTVLVAVQETLGVGVAVPVGVLVAVAVGMGLAVYVGVWVAVLVALGDGVSVGVGVWVARRATAVSSSVGETMTVGVCGASMSMLQPANSSANGKAALSMSFLISSF